MRIIPIVVILLLLCGVGICAESQPPAPSRGKKVEQPNANTQKENASSDQLKVCTESLAAINKLLDTQGQEKTANKTTPHHKEESTAKWWKIPDVWVAAFTGILALITGALAYFTLMLWRATKTMVDEASITSKRQATQTEEALEISRNAANAAIEANALSRDIFTADQRPWISVDVEIASPLTYDDAGWDAGVRWHIALKYRLHHIGKTPATNVSFFGEIIPFTISHWPANMVKDGIPQGVPIDGTDVAKEIETVCSFPESMSKVNMGFGQLLFPDESKVGLFGLNGNPARFEEAKTNEGYGGQFLVVVCATYESTFSRESYRTAKAYHLYKRTGDQRINLDGETIQMSELGFTPNPQQIGSYAS